MCDVLCFWGWKASVGKFCLAWFVNVDWVKEWGESPRALCACPWVSVGEGTSVHWAQWPSIFFLFFSPFASWLSPFLHPDSSYSLLPTSWTCCVFSILLACPSQLSKAQDWFLIRGWTKKAFLNGPASPRNTWLSVYWILLVVLILKVKKRFALLFTAQ